MANSEIIGAGQGTARRAPKIKALNLYAGIGGNRQLWSDCEVTAVELDPKIAAVYQSFFPQDTVIVGDAHAYLQEHYSEFDFIWSSPPCPTHGQYRYNVGFRAKGYKAVFPDMQLYEEIIFLKHYFSGLYCVENTKPYYEPLIAPSVVLSRHLFWSNFEIAQADFGAKHIRDKNKISDYDTDISETSISNKRQVLRNCVDSNLGLHLWNEMRRASCTQDSPAQNTMGICHTAPNSGRDAIPLDIFEGVL
jgi:DNA (cytosine-5)-methyltransferase 1